MHRTDEKRKIKRLRKSWFLTVLLSKSGIDKHSRTLTTSKKKSTCGLLCTKNRTGCLSMTTCVSEETQYAPPPRVHVDRQCLAWMLCVQTCRCVSCTLRMKSGGVPGLTVGLRTPSWWEWISVSSRSRTRIFLFTASRVYWQMKRLRRVNMSIWSWSSQEKTGL